MKSAHASHPAFFRLALAAALLAGLGGVGLAMWMKNGAALFLSLAEAGLAWCF